MCSSIGRSFRVVIAMLAAMGGVQAAESMGAAERLQLASRSTFEVVLPKVEPAYVKYEKPLPLELLSFTERNDKYWSIGTAFAIGEDRYVSAAHVLHSGLGSGMGMPSLRTSTGEVYPVDRVLKHSVHEDYIVFSVKGAPPAEPIVTNADASVGSQVFAVGNALGEGVVIRDGLLTSLTPEDQDGRWKWLRFSAAASPGNSGGPLLDEQGRVIGVITAKSPNENLNFALPIAQVLKGREDASVTDVRASFGLPIIRGERVTQFKGEFPLPASWSAFTTALLRQEHRSYLEAQAALLEQESQKLLPRGDSARLLATLDMRATHALAAQQDDDSWGLKEGEDEEETELPDDGMLWLSRLDDIVLFRLQRPAGQADVKFYQDGHALMDLLLKGLKIPRVVGTQAIRITSLGPPQTTKPLRDRFGRIWQRQTWNLGYSDLQILILSLPTPEGYAGLLTFGPAISADSAGERLRLTADYMHASYRGSIAQWRAFLSSTEWRPDLLRDTRLANDATEGLSLSAPAFQVRIPQSILKLDDSSRLTLNMAFANRRDTVTWEPLGFLASDKFEDGSFIEISGQLRPAKGAGTKLNERWTKLSAKQGEYAGEPQHSAKFDQFWTRSVLGNPEGDRLFEIVMSLKEKSMLPRTIAEKRDLLIKGITLVGVPK